MADSGSETEWEESQSLPPQAAGSSNLQAPRSLAERGFVPKKRKLLSQAREADNAAKASEDLRIAQRPTGIDFVIENPLDGKLKETEFIKSFLQKNSGTVFTRSTSYCHYGVNYRKRTIFFTSLKSFSPTMPCPAKPCIDWRVYTSHTTNIASLPMDSRNSIPDLLTDAEIDAWVTDTPWASNRMFVDVFSGYGSVVRRVRNNYPGVFTYANDIVLRPDNDVEIDMQKFNIGHLLTFAAKKHFPEDFHGCLDHNDGIVGWFRKKKIAVLLHISCPCETYSTAAGSTHRNKKSPVPKTTKAIDHDRMNASIVEWLNSNTL